MPWGRSFCHGHVNFGFAIGAKVHMTVTEGPSPMQAMQISSSKKR